MCNKRHECLNTKILGLENLPLGNARMIDIRLASKAVRYSYFPKKDLYNWSLVFNFG